MIRAVHLCLERLTRKEGVQEGLAKKIKSLHSTFRCAEDTHIRVDATDRYGEHTVKIRVRQNDESDQVTHGKYPGEETRLDGTTNKSVQNCIRLTETGSRTGKDDDQSNW